MSILKRISKMEQSIQEKAYLPVVFLKPGESPGVIGPKTVVIIDDLPEDD